MWGVLKRQVGAGVIQSRFKRFHIVLQNTHISSIRFELFSSTAKMGYDGSYTAEARGVATQARLGPTDKAICGCTIYTITEQLGCILHEYIVEAKRTISELLYVCPHLLLSSPSYSVSVMIMCLKLPAFPTSIKSMSGCLPCAYPAPDTRCGHNLSLCSNKASEPS